MGRAASVAVVGAGLSGAAAARRLAEAGVSVTVFDKSRGVGGRMATRRAAVSGLAFDHGAQTMRAEGGEEGGEEGARFAAVLADWAARGLAAPWGEPDRFVGIPGMTAPARDLLAGLDVRCGRTVTGLARKGAGWSLSLAEGASDQRFDAVALSVPAPQAARLLAACGLSLPGVEIPAYAPCWAVMLAFEGEIGCAGADLCDEAGPIAAVFREDAKPGRAGGGPRLVIHASPAWSRAHLEESREAVAAAMAVALARATGGSIAPIHAVAHRWRYALVETALGEACLWDSAQRLGACGDGCLGPRVAAAFDSGEALAARIIAELR